MTQKKKKRKNTPHDGFVKDMMEYPVIAVEVLQECLPAKFQATLDLKTLKNEKESYVTTSLKKRLSDLVYSVKTKDGEDAFIYLLVEAQSEPDYWIAMRLMEYTLLLLQRHKKGKGDDIKLPLVVPLVIYNGKTKYDVPRNFWQLFENPELAKQALTEDYHLLDLQSMSDNDIDYEKYVSFMLYTMKHIHERDMLNMLEKAMELCKKSIIIDQDKNCVLMRAIIWYTDAKVPSDDKEKLEKLFVSNLNVEKNIVRTVADVYRDEGREEGRVETAIKMMENGFNFSMISSITGLSDDALTKLKKDSNIWC